MLNPYIEINHEKLIHNLDVIKSVIMVNNLNATVNMEKVKPPKIMAVVKSNAYGHGMIEVSQTLESKVDMFGVGTLKEGVLLSQAGIKKEILVMGPCYDFALVNQYSLMITVENLEQLKELNTYCEEHDNVFFDVHLKIDTGMHRFGVLEKDIESVLVSLSDHIRLRGVFSHMLTSPLLQKEKVLLQLENFKKAKVKVEKWHKDQQAEFKHLEDICFHLANSESAIDVPETRFDMIRIGNGLFGPTGTQKKVALKRIAQVKLPVISVHEHKKGDRIGYGHKIKLKKDTVLGVCMGGFYEGNGLVKASTGLGAFLKIKYFVKGLVKGLVKKDTVIYQDVKYNIMGSVFMQFIQIDMTSKPLKVGDYIEVIKSPLYFDSALKRIHLLEENHGTH